MRTTTIDRAIRWALLATTLGGCERVVSVEVPEGPKHLVVEARLERVQGRVTGEQTVRLTTTAPYFDHAAPPPARGAVVRVTDETGAVTPFAETSPGTYTTTALTGVVGRAYTLAIDWSGERYEATERLQPVTGIDSLYFAPPALDLGDSPEGLRATIDLRDPRGTKNWYLWDQLVDGRRLIASDSTSRERVTSSDEGIDGRRVRGYQPYGGVPIAPGSVVVVRQVGLSETGYRYYLALSEQTSNDGSPFAVPPSSVRGNVTNRTDPSHVALGYFIAGEVAEKRAVLPR